MEPINTIHTQAAIPSARRVLFFAFCGLWRGDRRALCAPGQRCPGRDATLGERTVQGRAGGGRQVHCFVWRALYNLVKRRDSRDTSFHMPTSDMPHGLGHGKTENLRARPRPPRPGPRPRARNVGRARGEVCIALKP